VYVPRSEALWRGWTPAGQSLEYTRTEIAQGWEKFSTLKPATTAKPSSPLKFSSLKSNYDLK